MYTYLMVQICFYIVFHKTILPDNFNESGGLYQHQYTCERKGAKGAVPPASRLL